MVLRKTWEDSRIPRIGSECAESAVAVAVGVEALKLRLNQEDGPSWHVEGMLEGQPEMEGQAFKLGSRLCGVLGASIRAVTLGGPLTTMDGRDLGPDPRSSARVRGAVVDDRCGGSLSKRTYGKDLGMILRKWRKEHLGEGWMSGLGKA